MNKSTLKGYINKYITGKYALNIHHPEKPDEPTGDWHGYIWDNIKELPDNSITYAGEGLPINTFHIWNDFGIFDDTNTFISRGFILKEKNIYVADYYRAILDLIYYSFTINNNMLELNCITYDHLDNDNQIMIVLDEVKKLKNHLSKDKHIIIDKWIDREKNYEFYRNTG